jgi:hypothetical protein
MIVVDVLSRTRYERGRGSSFRNRCELENAEHARGEGAIVPTQSDAAEALEPSCDAVRSNPISSSTSPLDGWFEARTFQIAMALSLLAFVRILFFVAVFPLCNNVDERFHLMSIRAYAHGHLPDRDLPHMDPEFARSLILYSSPEYWSPEDGTTHGRSKGPLLLLPASERDQALLERAYVEKLEQWERRPNYEAQAVPGYYAALACWYKLGAVLGLSDWALVYWLRFVNPFAYGLFVWFSYKFVKSVYPEDTFLQIAVPALLAVFPQDVFFGLNRDVLSPLLASVALLLMSKAIKRSAGWRELVIVSFLVGLMFLVEVSNFVFYGTLMATLLTWLKRSEAPIENKLRVTAASAGAALLLPVVWMTRNYFVIGDLTGSSAKVHELGWTVNSLPDIVHHPLFTWHGATYFLVRLTGSFWHGEYLWHGQPMRSGTSEWFYVISSAAMVLIFAFGIGSRWKTMSDLHKWWVVQMVFLVAASVLFLAAVSLPFDYHNCGYPSRLHPFFVSGRIICGVLLPFAMIYAGGLELILKRAPKWAPSMAVLACLMLVITISEVQVRKVVFTSPYNFFALAGWQQ